MGRGARPDGRKKGGRKGAKSKAGASRRGMSVKEKAHFVFKHRYLIVKRRENLTESERGDLTQMLEYLPALATLRRFTTGSTGCSTRPGLSPSQLPSIRDRARTGVSSRAGVGQGAGPVERREVPQMMAYLKNPLSRRCGPTIHVERTNGCSGSWRRCGIQMAAAQDTGAVL